MLVAPEDVHARDLGHLRLAGHARRHDELLRPQRELGAVVLDDEAPLPCLGVVRRGLRLRRAPVVELHDPRVHLEPVADLVLRREHRPVLGELEVRHVVVPDRVVEAERLVALAPGVAGTLVALDDDRGDAELAQPGAEGDAALPAADDDDLGLHLVAELARLALAHLQPAEAVRVRAVDGAGRAVVALGLLVALELAERGEQRPRLAVAQAQDARAPADRGLERDPGLRDAVGLRGRLRRAKSPSAARAGAGTRASPGSPRDPRAS